MAHTDTLTYHYGIIESCRAARNKAALLATGEIVTGIVMAVEGQPLPAAALIMSGAYLGKLALDEHGYIGDARSAIVAALAPLPASDRV